jgi:hypothetical protein
MNTEATAWIFTWPNMIDGDEMNHVLGPAFVESHLYDSIAFFDPDINDIVNNEKKNSGYQTYLYGYYVISASIMMMTIKILDTVRRLEKNVTSRESVV